MPSDDGRWLAVAGAAGAVHVWRRIGPDPAAEADEEGRWEPALGPTGHAGPVVDVAFAPEWPGASGSGGVPALLTAGGAGDQTARLWTRLRNSGGCWVETSRPQVHGHDLRAVAVVAPGPSGTASSSPWRYVSASEERPARVLSCPGGALATVVTLGNGGPPPGPPPAAFGAAASALCLSPRAMGAPTADGPPPPPPPPKGGGDYEDPNAVPDFAPGPALPAALSAPPPEEHLAGSSLWVEDAKLYGHSDDLWTCAASPLPNDLVVTASVARDAEGAAPRVWDTAVWRPVGAPLLGGPGLTATRLRFSPSGGLLVAAGRDRSLSVWRRRPTDDGCLGLPELACVERRAHGRVIWDCDVVDAASASFIVPDAAGLVATASRCGRVAIWGLWGEQEEEMWRLARVTSDAAGDTAATALAWAPTAGVDGSLLLAVGRESGGLELWRVSRGRRNDGTSTVLLTRSWAGARAGETHGAAVRRVAWATDDSNTLLLASGGDDGGVRVFRVGD